MTPFSRSTGRDRKRNRRHLALEPLEGRELMSLGAEIAGTVNTTTRNAQFDSANASSFFGSSVVVWTDTFSMTNRDIRAQRFNASGTKVGPEILVSGCALDEFTPSVAMDNLGDFVVAWTQRQASGDTNVIARKFSPTGIPLGGVVPVGVGTFAETDPQVAMDARGDFVVAYTRNTNNNNPDVFAKRYNTSEQLLGVISVATTVRAETHPSVAMTPDGRFDVAWEFAFSATDHDIMLNQYNALGGMTAATAVTASTANEILPSVSVDNLGNAVVAWQKQVGAGFDIQARRVTSNGLILGAINIATTSADERNPSVALKQVGGAFVVAYESIAYNFHLVKVAEVSAFGTVTTFNTGVRMSPAVSLNGVGQYVLTSTSSNAGDLNIRRRLGHVS